ncbi:interleukin-5 receptor subunit alpha-like [Eleutherodactylus coqui]|uniref:interleukin-5 receptor subunit alpha-like n=1 Tax=Eleutherodactylus coqui TaxID=57060 RepID=UPI003462BA78
MMVSQENEKAWILQLVLMVLSQQVYATDGSGNFILKQPNITISSVGFNFVNISWEPEEIIEKGHFSVCYNFSYGFLNKEKKWLKLSTNYHKINLRMHSRVEGSVSNALCKLDHILVKSKPTEFVYNSPQIYIDIVSCVLLNITNLNCSWNVRADAPDDINYSFALRLNSKWLPCPHYFKRQKKNVGCYMQNVFSDYKDGNPLSKIKTGFFSSIYNFSKTFKTEAIEILTPPRNIQVSSDNGNTIIKWLPPTSIAINSFEDDTSSTYDSDEEANFFLYEIRLIENKSKKEFRQTPIEEQEQVFTDLEKDKKYYLQIRARHKRRDLSKFWGEWSIPIFINEDNYAFPDWILIMIAPAMFATITFFLCKRYMKKLLITSIPHPSQNIKNWLHMNESTDIRMQANIAAQHEQSVPLTEIEIVTKTTDCDWKP